MSDAQVSVRFSVEDAETVRQALDKLGSDGDAALRKLDAASRAGAPGLSALDKIIGTLRERVVGMALSVGPAGSVLIALGPAGVAAAAGLGALVSVLGKVAEVSDQFASRAAEVRNLATALGLNTTEMQALQSAGAAVGMTNDQVASSLTRLSNALVEAHTGQGKLFDAVRKVSPELAKQLLQARDEATAISIVARAYEQAANARDKLAIAANLGRTPGAGNLLAGISAASGVGAMGKAFAPDAVPQETIERVSRLKTQIEEINRKTANIWGSAFSDSTLEAQRASANLWHDIAEDAARLFAAIEKNKSNGAAGIPAPGAEFGVLPGAFDSAPGLKITVNRGIPAPGTPMPRSRPSPDNLGPPSAAANLTLFREMLALLGQAATPAEQLKLKLLELAAAQEKGGVATSVYNRAVAATILAEQQQMVSAREKLGIVTAEQLQALNAAQLDDQTAKGFIRNAQERATAEAILAKQIQETLRAQEIRGAQFSGLKQIEVDARDLTKTLDQLGTQETSNLVSGLTDIGFSSDGAAAGMKRLEQQIARTAVQMMLQITVGRTMAAGLQGLLGLFAPSPGVLPGGAPLGQGGIGHAAAGGSFGPGAWAEVGERGRELMFVRPGGGVSIIPLSGLPGFADGGTMSPSGSRGALAYGGVNVTINNNAGADVQVDHRQNSSGGTDLLVMIDRRQDGRVAKGEADNSLGARYGLRPPMTRR